jgi:hypothetical protein
MRRLGWFGVAVVVGCLEWGGVAGAQTQTTTTVVLPVPLLPETAQGIARSGDVVAGEDPAQADPAAAQVLKEDGLQRFARAQYGGTKVQALQFNDATGAYSAFTFYSKNGMRSLMCEACGADQVETGDGRTLVRAQTVVLIVESANAQALLMKLVPELPKISGPRSQPPLLPTFFPTKGLVQGSLRYALGSVSYAAMSGALEPGKLGWEKSAEAATADYSDKRGKETLTLLLYPTPQIAGDHTHALEAASQNKMKVRREGELVIVAAGTFSADDTQNFVENIHLRSEVTFDKPMPPEFHAELRKTYSLLSSIAILSGAGMLAAVVLGFFLGGGRALVRKMQGKDAATEAEFLSLHLDNQNPKPKFGPPGS